MNQDIEVLHLFLCYSSVSENRAGTTLQAGLQVIVFVFISLRSSPPRLLSFSILDNSRCARSTFQDVSATSSAKSKSVMTFFGISGRQPWS